MCGRYYIDDEAFSRRFMGKGVVCPLDGFPTLREIGKGAVRKRLCVFSQPLLTG